MTLRRLLSALGAVLLAILAAPGVASAATFETTNFVVECPERRPAPAVRRNGRVLPQGEGARLARPRDARLARALPTAREARNGLGRRRDDLHLRHASGNRPVVTSQRMEIRGDAKQLLNSVLPHEVTHTVLAYHFGRAVPRWADEGGSVLSENEEERFSHDIRCRELLNAGRGIVLRTLFRMAEYPRDMIVLYAQGYSITAFLVEKGGGGRRGARQAPAIPGQWNGQRLAARPASEPSWNAGKLERSVSPGLWLRHCRCPGEGLARRPPQPAVADRGP